MADKVQILHWTQINIKNDEKWERAYKEFETSEEEISKFKRRLKKLGANDWSRSANIVELFCGRGNGLVALEDYGFTSIQGVDLSEALLKEYPGSAQLFVGDCRDLKFRAGSKDIVIVQGGLHHLPVIPDDLEKVFLEIKRILKKDGLFIFVEPWQTPFLALVHFALTISPLTSQWPKLNALKDMVNSEKDTYFNWLGKKKIIRSLLDRHFIIKRFKVRLGKLHCIAQPHLASSKCHAVSSQSP